MKREEKVIQQWTRLIQGLRIRQKLQEQYGPIQKPKGDEVEEVCRHNDRSVTVIFLNYGNTHCF